MVHVVTTTCVDCLHLDCVPVCPVQCFFRADRSVVIDGAECINCGICVTACPVRAIRDEGDLQPDEQWLVAWNTETARASPRAEI